MTQQTTIPVLNATPLAAFAWEGGKFSIEPTTPEGVRDLFFIYEDGEEFFSSVAGLVSYIGHQSTVDVFNTVMGFEGAAKLPVNRASATLAPGEIAVVIALKGRAPAEGTVLRTAAEVEAAGYGLFILRRLE